MCIHFVGQGQSASAAEVYPCIALEDIVGCCVLMDMKVQVGVLGHRAPLRASGAESKRGGDVGKLLIKTLYGVEKVILNEVVEAVIVSPYLMVYKRSSHFLQSSPAGSVGMTA